ncbi:DEAD/DEAH box helicase [Rosistilla oblonga]|uniref:DEAD/DEAH box helicase n=1 Tax=Rosistilla oblonga TaxID=2527990 RepID=UPI003A96A11D
MQESPIDRDQLAVEYLELLPYEPYPVQEEALLAWFSEPQGVLVAAPTGTGKTLIAEAAVYEALKTGKQMYYTTPLIALTDQKLVELQETVVRWGYPAESVGLVTGNRRVNPDAPILVVVAEILLNRLLNREAFDFADVTSVVMDEFHSFNDSQRGIVWELTLGMLPEHVRTLLLSATVGNSVEFVSWLYRSHNRRLRLVQGTERKIPLQYWWVDDQLIGEFAEKITEGSPEVRRTPALIFCFNRDHCWLTAEQLKGKGLVDAAQKTELANILNAEDLSEGAGPKMKQILMRGVGIHHAGILPRYRRLVESLFQKKLLSVCVCTETLSAGINLPARSVVLPSLLKGPKGKKKVVEPSSAHQIFGRAGRPQFDTEGHVFALAHEDDVKILRWKEKYDQIPEDTKDPGLMKAKKQLKKKMPKRRQDEAYWNLTQFEQLQNAAPAKLASRGQMPWRLMAYLLGHSSDIQPLRDFVGRRLMNDKELKNAQTQLNRMLVVLWSAKYIELDPKPAYASADASPKKQANAKQSGEKPEAPKPKGLFGEILQQMEPEPKPESEAKPATTDDGAPDEAAIARGYDYENYKPLTATPTPTLELLVRLRSIHPLYGVYMADHMLKADTNEKLLALESVLDIPGNVARSVRVPGKDELPPGPLATEVLDPRLLKLGLATAEELGAGGDDEEEDSGPRGRKYYDEPPVRVLTLGDKLYRMFHSDVPGVHDVRVNPVWIAGEVLEYGDFNKYILAKKLQKQEGILFRHLLRLIMLIDEMAEIPPLGSTPETWEDILDDIADRLTEICRRVDPESTDEAIENATAGDDLLPPVVRRKAQS